VVNHELFRTAREVRREMSHAKTQIRVGQPC
jgi:hypothetical protein